VDYKIFHNLFFKNIIAEIQMQLQKEYGFIVHTSASSDSLSVATPNFGTGAWSGPETLLAWLRVLLHPEICDMDSDGFSSMTSDSMTSLTVLLPAVPMLKEKQKNRLISYWLNIVLMN
jgi:hypothetical protein